MFFFLLYFTRFFVTLPQKWRTYCVSEEKTNAFVLFFSRLFVTLQLKKNENEETYDIPDAVLLRNGGDEC